MNRFNELQDILLRTRCGACGAKLEAPVMSLGGVPLANEFTHCSAAKNLPVYPLDLCLCHTCGLLQLGHLVSPSRLFSSYPYLTGTSSTMKIHFEDYARRVIKDGALDPGDLVVDIGSNDATLLRCFKELGTRILGVDPAKNLAKQVSQQGIHVIPDFFSSRLARRIMEEYGPASVITANNVMAHVPEPSDVLKGFSLLLAPGGKVIAEVPYLADLLAGTAFDTIYHEHVSYFSVSALVHLFRGAGMVIEKIVRLKVHGGSLRIIAGMATHTKTGPEVEQLVRQESKDGLRDQVTIDLFEKRVRFFKERFKNSLLNYKKQGKSLAAYGAPAKGSMLLFHCGIGPDILDYTVDANPLKQGMCMPGTAIPIFPVSRLKQDRPDLLIILPWNMADEIIRQESWFSVHGGKFIIPLPLSNYDQAEARL
ncbi:MAG: class I SAM-dependent methyltransferase [Deltaproteobacteria bacterium]|nr:class I SAM-dependent methyltransferase [Deltaproteobacteria bacterium]